MTSRNALNAERLAALRAADLEKVVEYAEEALSMEGDEVCRVALKIIVHIAKRTANA